MSSPQLQNHDLILDPWNGAGTTTTIGSSLGKCCTGLDLNPVMVIVAKARLLSAAEKPSVAPLAHDIISKAREGVILADDDPLSLWFRQAAAQRLRAIERAIYRLLISPKDNDSMHGEAVNRLSSLAAFFYTALFRSVRSLVSLCQTSNPTWIKRPAARDRLVIQTRTIDRQFVSEVNWMSQRLEVHQNTIDNHIASTVTLGSSSALPLTDGSVGLVLASPPYCTRIDYAVATRPELATLGYDEDAFDRLRRKLIGTTTVEQSCPTTSADWGTACGQFLNAVRNHRSRASATYYLKSHAQYFQQLYASIKELKRVLGPSGACLLVVQDSYYKEVHNDLPRVVLEMAENVGLQPMRRVDFNIDSTLARVNPGTRAYRTTFNTTESVLCLQPSH